MPCNVVCGSEFMIAQETAGITQMSKEQVECCRCAPDLVSHLQRCTACPDLRFVLTS